VGCGSPQLLVPARVRVELAADQIQLVRGRQPGGRHRGGHRQRKPVLSATSLAGTARQLIQAAAERFGRVDVVISNAGGSPPAAAATASPRFHAKVIELNLIAPLHVAQSANELMQEQPAGGSIILVGSVSGTRPSPGTAAYGAAKAGLHHLATSLAVEWAPKVRVNCVVPGLVATGSAADYYGGQAGVAAVAGSVPLGRVGSPGDVADACLFLASPLASYLSAAALVLHGGGERPAFLTSAGSVYAPRD
jgi:NAD(P)-dependent dehydrogenase (short-subunit alcohol dehydrogenase family)